MTVATRQRIGGATTSSAFPAIVTVLLGYRLPQVGGGVILPLILAIICAPAWLRGIRRYKNASSLMALTLAASINGVYLASFSAEHYLLDWNSARFTVLFLMSTIFSIPLLLWARDLLGIGGLLAAHSTGALVRGALSGAESWEDFWKYNAALPATLLLAIALLGRAGSSSRDRRTNVALLLLVILPLSLGAGARSFSGFVALSAAMYLLGSRDPDAVKSDRGGPTAVSVGIRLAAAATIVYHVGAWLAQSGFLGAALAERTAVQDRLSGLLLTAARPEWGATFRIFGLEPWGLGPGVSADGTLLAEAKLGLQERGVRTGGNYTNEYLFGSSGVKLHAVAADLWLNFGVVGALLASYLLILLLQGLFRTVASVAPLRYCSILVTIIAAWGLFFGPMLSNLPDIALALALTLRVQSSGGQDESVRSSEGRAL